jgi:hypothetical protein
VLLLIWEAHGCGFLGRMAVADKGPNLPLVGARQRLDGVVYARGVDHHHVQLAPEHGHIYPELLDVFHEVAETGA